MRRIFIIMVVLSACVSAVAQTMNIKTGSVTYSIPATQAGDMLFDNGTTLTFLGKTINVADIDNMYVDDSSVDDNSVVVVYDGDNASVTIAGNIAQYIDAQVSGAYVSIIQASTVGDDTSGEITYSLKGSSDNGNFYLEGSYKTTIALLGLTLNSNKGAVLDLQDSKRVAISAKSGSVNVIGDVAGGSQKGCIACKGHIEFKGSGSITIDGNTGHAVYAKEYVTMKNCTITINSAVKDGINCNQYFTMDSGKLYISGTGDDAIQVAYKDDENREEEDTGCLTINGGELNASVTATAAKALKAEGDIIITGGTITLATSGGGMWDSADVKTKASSCIGADGNVRIDGGTLVMNSTGCAGKGISCDADCNINGGDISITTKGGIFAYINGTEYTDYTGNTDNIDSDYKSSPKGIKADGCVNINGGTINVNVAKSEGIESKSVLTVNDGKITVNAYDDAINSSSNMYIKGGELTVVATNNDGLDANGNIYVSGGTTMAFGGSSPECGIDANTEKGYAVYFTGGTLLAAGGGNSLPSSSSSASTQPYISTSASLTAGSTVTVSNGSTVLATFVVPENYSGGQSSGSSGGRPGGPGGMGGGSSLAITCPGLTSGSSYTLTYGTSSTTVTAK
ncbi:MAG: carbohydrate-binding domain-containing protein [Prevotella sp.]